MARCLRRRARLKGRPPTAREVCLPDTPRYRVLHSLGKGGRTACQRQSRSDVLWLLS